MRSSRSVDPRAYVYWHQKEQFQLEQDTSGYWTMFAVESGRFTYKIGREEGDAGFADLVVCPPHTAFHRRTLTPLTFHFVQFIWEIEPGEEEAKRWTGKITIADTERLASTYRYLRSMSRVGLHDPASGPMRHLLNDLLLSAELERSLQQDEAREGADPLMHQARLWLLAHAFEPFAMSELSAALGLSPVQLTRKFRAAYGHTPSAYVTELRISRACRLLEETTLTLEAIAQRCGYENGFYLSRVFRSRMGTVPSAYRKLHRV
ncbi:helix-turn-helix domain-containing protein [Paenibacillus cremeus]|uniref:Helix-turn-helix transcriptional regulator n=1 Tax=Paenibacillus cremeus TaxID=2163881 RepID=A0A559KFM6_9BACL|nr:AraC family transcriptional regulator [Paenibacillus cremeus]TVY10932.1 helix-turn-helix transcriptional regulator [Paenibacillus cremeus]